MDPRAETVIALMRADLRQNPSVCALAEAVHLSESYLRQLFKAETGTTLRRYFSRVRMERAKELLETTFLTVKSIGLRVGITGASQFIREFERTYGTSPARHAQRYRIATSRAQTKAANREQKQ